MATSNERAVLKRILDRYDDLGAMRERLLSGSVGATESRQLVLKSRRAVDAIGRDVGHLPVASALGSLLQRYKLTKYEFVLMLALLRRRLVHENPYMKGRELVALLFESSFDVLRGANYLDPTGALQSAGLIIPDVREDSVDDDWLDMPFKLSDRVFRLVRGAFLAHPGGAALLRGRSRATAYKHNAAYVLDWRRLSLLYRKRAARIFQFDYWDDVGLGTAETVTALRQQIDRFRGRMTESFALTKKGQDFALEQLRAEFKLGDEETLILVTLMFQELMEGSAFLDAVDLLKLISADEEDLLKKRRFLAKRSTLVKNNLVALEETVHDKELTAEVYLPNWVTDRMLGQDAKQKIDADTKLDFHEYLKDLGSSDRFFDDLESEP
ncbi:MAG: hypothetical protein JNL94_01825 [Planctomycetes bacterium]|nr:hypothetical protein [Planctomycetota bacterium]